MIQALDHISEMFTCYPTLVQEHFLELIVVNELHSLSETGLTAFVKRILLQAERHVLDLFHDRHQNFMVLQTLVV